MSSLSYSPALLSSALTRFGTKKLSSCFIRVSVGSLIVSEGSSLAYPPTNSSSSSRTVEVIIIVGILDPERYLMKTLFLMAKK